MRDNQIKKKRMQCLLQKIILLSWKILMTFSKDRNMYSSVEMSKSEFEKLG